MTVLIVAEDELQDLTSGLGPETYFRVFADTGSIRALECISRDRPGVVVLERAFVGTPRGASLVHAIKTDRGLADTQIRVISSADEYVRLVGQTEPEAVLDAAMPGEPLPADYLGTRAAPRHKLPPGVVVRVAGIQSTLVELSGTGAQVVGATRLRLKQHVRVVMGTQPDVVHCSGVVVWVRYELQGRKGPSYRAGVRFVDADPQAIEDFVLRHARDRE